MKQIALNIMEKTISVNGMAVVTVNDDNRVKNIQFLPDDELALVLEQGSTTNGQLQLLRNASFDYVANKPRQRAQGGPRADIGYTRRGLPADAEGLQARGAGRQGDPDARGYGTD